MACRLAVGRDGSLHIGQNIAVEWQERSPRLSIRRGCPYVAVAQLLNSVKRWIIHTLPQSNDLFHTLQCRRRYWLNLCCSLSENGLQCRQVIDQLVVAFLNGPQRLDQPLGQCSFKVAIAFASKLVLNLLLRLPTEHLI